MRRILSVLALTLLSCADHDAPGPFPVSPAIGIVDLRTGYSRDPASLPFWIDPREFPPDYLTSETLRLVHWPSADLVAGTWRPMRGEVLEGVELLHFVPDAHLSDGWYAIQVRLPAWNYYLQGQFTTEDGWATQRGHVGSLPTAVLAGDSSSGLVLHFSEAVTFDEEYDLNSFLEYTIDGQPARCRYLDPDQEVYRAYPRFTGGPLFCDELPEGAVGEIRVREGLFVRGRSLLDRSGGSPPHWTFRRGEAVVPSEPTEAYFMRRLEDLAP